MNLARKKTKTIKIGNVLIGAAHPVAIQSMVKCKTSDSGRAIKEINYLEQCGCEIVRLAVKDSADASSFRQIKRKTNIPLVADIHFDWSLALEAIENGADKIRLNPGNIYKRSQIQEIVTALKIAKIPLRIGLNSGSVKNISGRKMSMADKLVNSALDYIKIVEKMGFNNLVISLKASTVVDTVDAYRKISKCCDYPLHLGVTATGLPGEGAIKSAIAIGALLLEGIGDTIRISLTARPEEEIRVARAVLRALDLRHFGPEVISCPTCGRCEVDLVGLVQEIEQKIIQVKGNKPLKIAVMGCVVNGPGEAKEADIGVAFGKNDGLLFKKGKAVRKVLFTQSAAALLKEIKRANG
ncbi:MAG: flavodoxin-dependent (E)-4-hydroxy-3-methylbut-2-enyl-diphosphate synthase [Candidatus Omnitrophica bacterium]|jgi:(E)-4-hydroxy-3-methylbut-2-enyl-diphosphate synthase|nr:flavodoxin-dependent (E)-4-hydroxy-3-methylbut-2-enyl-diphosphate synthase [Candidatus Omnitrophota bacterium]